MEAPEIQVGFPPGAERRSEPVTCGIPWPRGALPEGAEVALTDAHGASVPVQSRRLDAWPDGSARWTLLDWQAGGTGPAVVYRAAPGTPSRPGCPVRASAAGGRVAVDTGRARFELGGRFPFDGPLECALEVEDDSGTTARPGRLEAEVEEEGPLRTCVRLCGKVGVLDLVCRLHFFAGSATVRFHLTLRNPRRARHPGGIWDLGDKGSVLLRRATFRIALPGEETTALRCSPEIGGAFEDFPLPFELYQDSSGGANWRSRSHLNRHGEVPHAFRGYRLAPDRTGLRATPVVTLARGERRVGLAMRYFWQNFPKAVEASGDALALHLFPPQFADLHELQGGEQKTHVFCLALSDEDLSWVREPAFPRAAPEWYCSSGAVHYQAPVSAGPQDGYQALLDGAVEGPDRFEAKREEIDEYGWRNFGDLYADHETLFHEGPEQLISHYNNQYDVLWGFAIQFLRSADERWWTAMSELAAHVADIDVYHTDEDKSAYNHGLFWHTAHYSDAGTATHRSYTRASGLAGGGSSNEHDYTTGLVLHHFLTGEPLSRETVLELARWVLDMEDGRKTVFRWLSRGDTGLSSSSCVAGYHGPGRGGGNTINALMDAHLLTRDRRYLVEAERIIRRCIHPRDDLAERNLTDAESRWSYNIFLQKLGRYLDGKLERGERDEMYAYARQSLLHYATWALEHERPYLSRPDILDFVTETWAAQDIRKADVLSFAAMHCPEERRAQFLERAAFFYRSSVGSLSSMATRSRTRPVAIYLTSGYIHRYLLNEPLPERPPAGGRHDFGEPERFVPQKQQAIRRLKTLAVLGGVVVVAATALLLLV